MIYWCPRNFFSSLRSFVFCFSFFWALCENIYCTKLSWECRKREINKKIGHLFIHIRLCEIMTFYLYHMKTSAHKDVVAIGLVSFLLSLELCSLQIPSVTVNLHPKPASVDRHCIGHEVQRLKRDGTLRRTSGTNHDFREQWEDNYSTLDHRETRKVFLTQFSLDHTGVLR